MTAQKNISQKNRPLLTSSAEIEALEEDPLYTHWGFTMGCLREPENYEKLWRLLISMHITVKQLVEAENRRMNKDVSRETV